MEHRDHPGGLSEAALDDLLTTSTRLQTEGALDDALAYLAVAVEELRDRGTMYPVLLERLAALANALGVPEQARLLLEAAREKVSGTAARFRIEVALAKTAIVAADLPAAAAHLAGLDGGDGLLGDPVPSRRGEIATWLRRYQCAGAHGELPRAEAALVIAELWYERGAYRSAREMIDLAIDQFPGAEIGLELDQVRLRKAELLVAAGELAAAALLLAEAPAAPIAALRWRLVSARCAFFAGRLGEARRVLHELGEAPAGDPRLVTAVALLRIAVLGELNLLGEATQVAVRSHVALREAGASDEQLASIARAAALIAARRTSTVTTLERPWVPELVMVPGARDDVAAGVAAVAPHTAGSSPPRLLARWTDHANRVLLALEREDLDAAEAHVAVLEELIVPVESAYLQARTRFARALVSYYRSGGPTEATAEELLAIAGELDRLGARLAAAQVTRFAAWAAGHRGRHRDYRRLTAEARVRLDAIAHELDERDRATFLLSRWSVRDEYVSARVDQIEAEHPGGTAPARVLVALFREIDALTHWPVDRALAEDDEPGARDLDEAGTPDDVARWIALQLAGRPRRAARGFALRSRFSLWRLPARALVVHYHVLPHRIFQFLLSRRGLALRVLATSRTDLDETLAACLGSIASGADAEGDLTTLAAMLGLDTALAAHPSIDRLIVVPHEVIANVPFAALRVAGAPLCQRLAIVQLDRVSRLRRRRWRRRPRLFAGVSVTEYPGTEMIPLDHAASEVAAAAAALGARRTELIADADASPARVLAALARASHVHVAAHGAFDHEQPHRSGLCLSGETGCQRLELAELRRAQARRLELAVLATCWSGQPTLLPGRERICLPTALLDAGARGVVASLWEVGAYAQGTSILGAFYRQLAALGPSRALANAQAELAQSGAPEHEWAGFAFYGND